MAEPKSLEALGRAVADEVGTGPAPPRRAAQKRAVQAHMLSGRPSKRRPVAAYVAVAAGIVAAIMGAALWLWAPWSEGPSQEQIAFWVGADEHPGEPGQWLEAEGQSSLQVRFEEGTTVEMYPGSTGRIASSNTDQVRVVLSSGTLRSTIRSKNHAQWIVQAGPFQVAAVGTEFSVAWDLPSKVLSVDVLSGVVLVEGGELDAQGVRLRAGQHLRATHGASQDEPEAVTDTSPAPLGPDAGPGDGAPPDVAAKIHRVDHGSPAPREPSWRELAEQRDYSAAIRAAEAQGIERLQSTLGAADLMRLADAARYARRPQIADSTLRALRRRFSGTSQASVAAFHLGRRAARSSPSQAAQWFQAYLRESPGGPLAQEARGRLVEVYRASGNRAQARSAAERYLRHHPSGPFRALAQRVLAGQQGAPDAQ